MTLSFSLSADELRRGSWELHEAAELIDLALVELPGPETRAGFAGPVRVAYDMSIGGVIDRLELARHELREASSAMQQASLSATE